MATLRIAWHDYNIGEDGFNIYRSDTPMDVNNMPSPIATVAPNIGVYNDTNVVGGNTYYYRIGVTRSGQELISEESEEVAQTTSIVAYLDDKRILKLDSINGTELASLNTTNITDIASIDVDNDGYLYIAMNNAKEVKKFTPDGTTLEWTSFQLSRSIDGMSIGKDGYVYAFTYNTLEKIDPTDGSKLFETTSGQYFRSVTATSSGYVWAGNSRGNTFGYTSSGDSDDSLGEHNKSIGGIASDANGNVITASDDNTIHKSNTYPTDLIWSFDRHTSNVNTVAVDSFNNIYSGSDDLTVRKIDSEGKQMWSLEGHVDSVESVVVDPSGYVYSASKDGTIKKITSDGKEVWTSNQYNSSIKRICIYTEY